MTLNDIYARDLFMTIIKWAEERASVIDMPRRKVLNNKELVDMSLERPTTKQELVEVVHKIAYWEVIHLRLLHSLA